MKNYRLKPEAVPFFKAKLATEIQPFDVWEKYHIDVEALEEVEDCHVKYGVKSGENSNSLSGWDEYDGARFHFTLIFPSVKWREYDRLSSGKVIRSLMDNLQSQANNFYRNQINETLEEQS